MQRTLKTKMSRWETHQERGRLKGISRRDRFDGKKENLEARQKVCLKEPFFGLASKDARLATSGAHLVHPQKVEWCKIQSKHGWFPISTSLSTPMGKAIHGFKGISVATRCQEIMLLTTRHSRNICRWLWL